MSVLYTWGQKYTAACSRWKCVTFIHHLPLTVWWYLPWPRDGRLTWNRRELQCAWSWKCSTVAPDTDTLGCVLHSKLARCTPKIWDSWIMLMWAGKGRYCASNVSQRFTHRRQEDHDLDNPDPNLRRYEMLCRIWIIIIIWIIGWASSSGEEVFGTLRTEHI